MGNNAIFKRRLFGIGNQGVLIRHKNDDTLYEYLDIGKGLGSVADSVYTDSRGNLNLHIVVDSKQRTIRKKSFKGFFEKKEDFIMNLVSPNFTNHSSSKSFNSRLQIGSSSGLVVTDLYDLDEVAKSHSDHWRMAMYLQKGYCCSNPNCQEEGVYFVKSVEAYSLSGVHIDIITKDFKLMTVDHILPKSKGGTDEIENLRPMCERCNSKLGNSMRY